MLLTCPVSSHRQILTRVCSVLPSHPILIGSSFAQGGFDWIARDVLRGNPRRNLVTIFGLKHYPFLCKASAYGRSVTLFGRFPDLRAGIIPFKPRNVEAVTTLLTAIFHKPFMALSDFIAVSIGTTNQMLHPSICNQLFKGWQPGMVYPKVKMFYAEVGHDAADSLYDLCMVEIPALAWALDTTLKRNGRLRAQTTYEPVTAVSVPGREDETCLGSELD